MSFVYPRTIKVKRAAFANTEADGMHQQEKVIAENIPASIQLAADRSSTTRVSPGPTDTSDAMPHYNIFIPLAALARGMVHKGDVIEDDLSVKYAVEGPYWNSLGYNLATRVLHP